MNLPKIKITIDWTWVKEWQDYGQTLTAIEVDGVSYPVEGVGITIGQSDSTEMIVAEPPLTKHGVYSFLTDRGAMIHPKKYRQNIVIARGEDHQDNDMEENAKELNRE